MRIYFEKAEKMIKSNKSITLDEALLHLLEGRLDNMVFRLGFAVSRAQARQMVSHGHFTVNGRKVNIPSYQVKPGEVIRIKEEATKMKPIEEIKKRIKKFNLSPWLEYLEGSIGGKVLRLPKKEDISAGFDLSLVIEFYSR